MNNYYVYGYRDPDSKIWRYVGKGKDDRLQKHLQYAKHLECISQEHHNPRLINWIRKLLRTGVEPEIIKIKTGMSSGRAFDYEVKLITRIGRVEEKGTLFNLDAGGVGGAAGRKDSEETRRKKREAHLGSKHSEETCRKRRESNRGKHTWSEEARRRQSERMKGKKLGQKESDGTRRKKSEAQKLAWQRRKVMRGVQLPS